MASNFSEQIVTQHSLGSSPLLTTNAQGAFSSIGNALKVLYVNSADLPQLTTEQNGHVLAAIHFGSSLLSPLKANSLSVHVHMPLIHPPEMAEVWLSSLPVFFDQRQNLQMAWNGNVVIGCIEGEELSENLLEVVARQAYEQILTNCEKLGFPHLFRMWNYFPNINEVQQGFERYKRFCIGRHEAFAARYQDFRVVIPAASAVGTSSGKFQVIFIAGKRPGIHLENPRQVSAYNYPDAYGPKSPSFARATRAKMADSEAHLYVAGTASIVGHASTHIGDPGHQVIETLANIQSLLKQGSSISEESSYERNPPALLKVYVRREADLPQIQEHLLTSWCHNLPVMYLRGDMCREELLVEIEGIWNQPPFSTN